MFRVPTNRDDIFQTSRITESGLVIDVRDVRWGRLRDLCLMYSDNSGIFHSTCPTLHGPE
ncbi:hypothetical protein PG996_011324 [Apiospora saccharicola]|uniref:Uncharacterized protein n=1 Tax=Apiospora saccharicola TaxID=335842 RepID=A0ABR1UER1_9PEZI